MLLYKKIINKLIDKSISVSVAESCTGGMLSSVFTTFKGVSMIFDMGLVTYSNKSKNSILKIPINIIQKNGAVSEKVSRLMVTNLAKISKSKLCISTTGIAGPGGAKKDKPVGLVFISINYNNKCFTFKKIFKGTRKKIQTDTIKFCFRKINELIQ